MSQLIEKNVLNFIGGISTLYFAALLSNLHWPFLPPQLLKFLKKDLLIRQVFLLFLVFISIQLTKGDGDILIQDKAISSLFLYIFILIFPKQTLEFSLVEMFLLLALYGIYYTLKTYTLEDKKENDLYLSLYSIGGVFCLLIVIGNIVYYNKQREDKGERFSYIKFFFGDPNTVKRAR